jgi:RNA polymerase sigma factor (sigma-70 family)
VFTTSLTLIGRLREPADAEAWAHFVALYAPLLRAWVRPLCGQDADADDVIQEVLVVVVRRLPAFAHSRRIGAFRTWLKAVAANKLGDHLRADARRPACAPDFVLAQLADPSSALSREWDRQHALRRAGRWETRGASSRSLTMWAGDGRCPRPSVSVVGRSPEIGQQQGAADKQVCRRMPKPYCKDNHLDGDLRASGPATKSCNKFGSAGMLR